MRYGSYVYCLSLFIDVAKFPRKQLRKSLLWLMVLEVSV